MQLSQLFISRKCNIADDCITGKIKAGFWQAIGNFNRQKSNYYGWQKMDAGSFHY
jgi:hypothetical protein